MKFGFPADEGPPTIVRALWPHFNDPFILSKWCNGQYFPDLVGYTSNNGEQDEFENAIVT